MPRLSDREWVGKKGLCTSGKGQGFVKGSNPDLMKGGKAQGQGRNREVHRKIIIACIDDSDKRTGQARWRP